MNQVIIRLGPGAPQAVSWAEKTAEGVTTFRGSLKDIAERLEGRRAVVLVPGNEVLLTQVRLPGGNRKRLAQAVPYALEESLAADVEEQHFALGMTLRDGAMAVAVVAKERLEAWLAMLQEVGLEPAFLGPETLAVPFESTRSSILLDGGLALVRTGLQSGFAMEPESTAAVLTASPGSREGSEAALYRGALEGVPAEFEPLVKTEEVVPDVLEVMAGTFEEQKSINLLQGAFSPHAQWRRMWSLWRLPVGLACAALLLHGSLQVQHYLELRSKSSRLTAQIEQIYRRTFPDAKKIVNPRAQMEHRLQELLGSGQMADSGFLVLLERAGPLLKATEGFELTGLRYREGRLDLEIALQDLQALDALKRKLAERDLSADIQTAASEGERVQARLQIKEHSS